MAAEQASTCKYHELNNSRLENLEAGFKDISDGQHRMELTVVKMESTLERIEGKLDNFGGRVAKMEGAFVHSNRVDKLEDRLAEHNKEQDAKISDLKAFMYKITGAIAVIAAGLPYFMKFLGV